MTQIMRMIVVVTSVLFSVQMADAGTGGDENRDPQDVNSLAKALKLLEAANSNTGSTTPPCPGIEASVVDRAKARLSKAFHCQYVSVDVGSDSFLFYKDQEGVVHGPVSSSNQEGTKIRRFFEKIPMSGASTPADQVTSALKSTLDAEKQALPLDSDLKFLQAVGSGSHPAAFLQDPKSGRKFFFKPEEKVANVLTENGASLLGHYLMNGLVPIAYRYTHEGKDGLIQNKVEFDDSKTKTIFSLPGKAFEKTDTPVLPYAQMSPTQREQLFAHMVTDYLIQNYDTHSGQFGIDPSGNVIGFDKGHAHKFDRPDRAGEFPHPDHFDPRVTWPPFKPNVPTYPGFAEYLQKNSAELSRIMRSKIVQGTFMRAKGLDPEQYRKWMSPYFHKILPSDEAERAANNYINHMRCGMKEVFDYFAK